MKKVLALLFATSMFVLTSCEQPSSEKAETTETEIVEEPTAPVEEAEEVEVEAANDSIEVADDSSAN